MALIAFCFAWTNKFKKFLVYWAKNVHLCPVACDHRACIGTDTGCAGLHTCGNNS